MKSTRNMRIHDHINEKTKQTGYINAHIEDSVKEDHTL
jgi:hypothetical protein